MYNVKIFPSSKLSENATKEDKLFLVEIVKVKEASGANFVNFSAYNYKTEATESVHFVTYPMDWVTKYIQSQFIVLDPLFKIDFRRVSYVDWSEFPLEDGVAKLFDAFQERGLGYNAITMTVHISAHLYGVVSFVFETDETEWEKFRRNKMELFRLLGERLSRHYDNIYNNTSTKEYKITKRETECLYWVAMGKTDDEIGEILLIGKWTVVGHLKSAKHKLGCSNRASAVAMAMSLGIIDIKAPT